MNVYNHVYISRVDIFVFKPGNRHHLYVLNHRSRLVEKKDKNSFDSDME